MKSNIMQILFLMIILILKSNSENKLFVFNHW